MREEGPDSAAPREALAPAGPELEALARAAATLGLVEVPWTELRGLVALAEGVLEANVVALLRDRGAAVETARDAREAADRFARARHDFVLVDARLPRGSGAEIVRSLKGALGAAETPILVVGAAADREGRAEALLAGADAFLERPFGPDVLFAHLAARVLDARAAAAVRDADALVRARGATDPATSLPRFSAVSARLAAEVERAEAHHEPLSVCLVALDGLRALEARLGRAAADAALGAVGRAARGVLRDADVLARYADGVLFAALPSTHVAGGLVAAERVRQAAAALLVDDRRAHVSIGAAVFPTRRVRTASALLGGAEAALGRAVAAGGDRVCLFHEEGVVYASRGA